jgi:carboxymethylenebutenolidase
MKRLIIILALLPLFTYAQHSCCTVANSTDEFQKLAMNDKFVASHLAPIPFTFEATKGKMVTYKTVDGKETSSFQVDAQTKSNNWLIVVHEWWGLNDYIKQEAERLAGEMPNVNVLAIDLYDGFVAATPDDAKSKMSSMNEEHTRAIIQGAIKHAGADAKIATLGWCMGGGWALQAEMIAGRQGAGCVMYYGMPETDVAKLKKLNADVLGLFASRDEWITPKVVAAFQENMKAAGKNLTVQSYDADHAFANPSNPKHDKDATADANAKALAFLKERLK